MIKPLRFTFLFSGLLLVSACASFTKSREQNISMANKAKTPAELIEVLGEPGSRTAKGDIDIWHYDVYSADSTKTYPYTAKVQGDKLLEFYADSSHESAEDRELRLRRKAKTHSRVELRQTHPGERRPTQVED